MKNLIYGFHAIEAYLKANPELIELVYIEPKKQQDQRIKELTTNLAKLEITFNYCELDKVIKNSHKLNHQGVIAYLKSDSLSPQDSFTNLKDALQEICNNEQSIVLILDGITDPHNLGAIIRTCDCFKVDLIILPKNNSANINNPIVAKTSSGAISHIPVITVNNLSTAIQTLKECDYWIAGTSLEPHSVNLFEFKVPSKLTWVMGSEGKGMRRLIKENCDYLVTIPMYGNTSSLNVSVATGVILSYTRLCGKTQL